MEDDKYYKKLDQIALRTFHIENKLNEIGEKIVKILKKMEDS